MSRRFGLTIDCADPETLVRFWCEALGYVEVPPPDGFATWREYWLGRGVPAAELGDGDCADVIADPDKRGPRIWFQPVPEPKWVKNRLHLDLYVGGADRSLDERRDLVDAEVRRLCAAGASVVQQVASAGQEHYHVVCADPEGNEFCVV